MADSMYCHACHHQWQRDSDEIECPQCHSATTEIVRESSPLVSATQQLTQSQVTPDDDPRHFHNPHPAATPNPGNTDSQPTTTPASAPDHEMTDVPASAPSSDPQDANASSQASGTTQQPGNGNGNGLRQEFFFVFPPPAVTFFTTVVNDTHVPPTDAAGPRGPPVTTFFSMNIMPPMIPLVHRRVPQPAAAASAESNGSPTQDQEGQSAEQQTPPAETQPQSQPQNAAPNGNRMHTPVSWLELLLGSIAGLNPANAAFGDAVYSQEALDRIITHLREANGPGGAPPASQAAIDKLEVKELDEKMLGGEAKTRCVICVDEMSAGEKASVLPCSHFFHGECVTPWLKQHNTCPVCRRSIEPEMAKPGKEAQFQQDQPHQHAPTTQDCS
ncbi:hypothetical protein OQA88_1863 [Cercophora sp. LCS_1]